MTEELKGADLARWCYENPNQAASTIEGLRGAPAQEAPSDDGRYLSSDIAKRMWQTFKVTGDRWFKYAALRLEQLPDHPAERPRACEGEKDTIVQLIHKHVGIRQRVDVDLTGVEETAEAILGALERRSPAEMATKHPAILAIEFVVEQIDDHLEMFEFLNGWLDGDTSEWPEFHAAAPTATDTYKALEAIKAAHASLFAQCCSNPIINAWGREVDVSLINEASRLAEIALVGRSQPVTEKDVVQVLCEASGGSCGCHAVKGDCCGEDAAMARALRSKFNVSRK